MIGALIMTHSDDDGLVMPPRIASSHMVIIPIAHKEETKAEVDAYCQALARELRTVHYMGHPLHVTIDQRDLRGGEKTWSWIKKGVPLRLEVGPRDITNDSFGLARRDRPHKETMMMSKHELRSTCQIMERNWQKNRYKRRVLRFLYSKKPRPA